MKLIPNVPQSHFHSTNTLSLPTKGKWKGVYLFSSGYYDFTVNRPITWNHCEQNSGLWLCLDVFFLIFILKHNAGHIVSLTHEKEMGLNALSIKEQRHLANYHCLHDS